MTLLSTYYAYDKAVRKLILIKPSQQSSLNKNHYFNEAHEKRILGSKVYTSKKAHRRAVYSFIDKPKVPDKPANLKVLQTAPQIGSSTSGPQNAPIKAMSETSKPLKPKVPFKPKMLKVLATDSELQHVSISTTDGNSKPTKPQVPLNPATLKVSSPASENYRPTSPPEAKHGPTEPRMDDASKPSNTKISNPSFKQATDQNSVLLSIGGAYRGIIGSCTNYPSDFILPTSMASTAKAKADSMTSHLLLWSTERSKQGKTCSKEQTIFDMKYIV